MNAEWINLRKCDVTHAKNLSLDWRPIVRQCYRMSDPKKYLGDANQHLFYNTIRKGDIVYKRSMIEKNPYFAPLFGPEDEALVYVETSPQLVSRIATTHCREPEQVGIIRQLKDETTSRFEVFVDFFDQLNRNTWR